MQRVIATLQLLTAALLIGAALTTLFNLILITTRPETISVVNIMIGQGLLIAILLALATTLTRRALTRWRRNPSDDRLSE